MPDTLVETSDASCGWSVSNSDAIEYGNSGPGVGAGERGLDGGDDPRN